MHRNLKTDKQAFLKAIAPLNPRYLFGTGSALWLAVERRSEDNFRDLASKRERRFKNVNKKRVEDLFLLAKGNHISVRPVSSLMTVLTLYCSQAFRQ